MEIAIRVVFNEQQVLSTVNIVYYFDPVPSPRCNTILCSPIGAQQTNSSFTQNEGTGLFSVRQQFHLLVMQETRHIKCCARGTVVAM